MKKGFLSFCCVWILGIAFCQKHDYTWVMGYNSNTSYPDAEGVFLNFNEFPVSVSYEPIPFWMRSSLACISDTSGQLLFYTNGCSIANGENEIIENGDGLNPGEVNGDHCEMGYPGGRQSCLILPGANSSEFYLFHKGIYYGTGNTFGGTNPLYYTLINMSLNSGEGKVVEKNIPLIEEDITYGQLTAVKHANGHDWWVITGGDSNNTYYKILLSGGNPQPYETQNIGMPSSYHGSRGGQANFSPDGTKYIRYSNPDGIFLFNFDRSTRLLSNFRHLPTPEETFADGVGVSPNSRYMYITTDNHVFQYDFQVPDVAASQIVVAEYDGFLAPFPTQFSQVQVAPDCKIFINTFATVDVLHVIHNPDEPGPTCNVEQHAVQLPFNHGRALPHFPNYRLGPLIPGETPAPPCSPVVSTEEQEVTEQFAAKFQVYPNPAKEILAFKLDQSLNDPVLLEIFHVSGSQVHRQLHSLVDGQFGVQIDNLKDGLYFCRLSLNGQSLGTRILAIVK